MNKAECEQAIRNLCHSWKSLPQHQQISDQNFDPSAFIAWLQSEHPNLLNFRSVESVSDVVEKWFAQELGQTWKY